MNKYLFFYILLISFTTFSQDDTAEEVLSANMAAKAELVEEAKELKFQKHFIQGLQERSIENYNKALEELAISEKIFPKNIALLFEIAKNHFALKQYSEAQHYIDKALQIEPDNYWILNLSHDIYFKQNNYPEAIRVRKKMYTMKKQAAAGLLKLYYYTKEKEKGKALIKEIEHKNIYVGILDFYKKYFEKIDQKTKDKVKETSNMKTPYVEILENLEQQLQDKDYTLLLTESDKAVALYPAQSLMYYYNGMALSGKGKHKQAVEMLEMGLDFVFDKPEVSKLFYRSLITSFTATNNSAKANYYKKLLGEL